ncbi:MAG: Rieske (2Fe-2S) protein [Thermoproteota archaeon]
MKEFVKVGRVDDVHEGETKVIKIGDEEIMLAKVGGNLYASSSTCTHLGFSLSGGKIEGTVLQCPHHRSKFDLRDGRVLSPPAKLPLRTYEVKVEGKEIFVREEPVGV